MSFTHEDALLGLAVDKLWSGNTTLDWSQSFQTNYHCLSSTITELSFAICKGSANPEPVPVQRSSWGPSARSSDWRRIRRQGSPQNTPKYMRLCFNHQNSNFTQPKNEAVTINGGFHPQHAHLSPGFSSGWFSTQRLIAREVPMHVTLHAAHATEDLQWGIPPHHGGTQDVDGTSMAQRIQLNSETVARLIKTQLSRHMTYDLWDSKRPHHPHISSYILVYPCISLSSYCQMFSPASSVKFWAPVHPASLDACRNPGWAVTSAQLPRPLRPASARNVCVCEVYGKNV